MKNLLRYFLLAAIFILLGLLYYNRKKSEKLFAEAYHQKSEYKYDKYIAPNALQTLLKNYKLSFYLYFSISNSILSIIIIHLLFRNKAYTFDSLLVYAFILTVVSLLILIGIIWIKNYVYFSFIYFIKLALYTPYLLLFLIIYFWKLKPSND